MLRKTLQELRIGAHQVIVAFLSGHANGRMDPLLSSNPRLSIHVFYGKVEGSDLVAEFMGVRNRYDKQIRILQHFYVVRGGGELATALVVAQPPVLQCKP